MNRIQIVVTLAAAAASMALPLASLAAEADYHHVHLTTSNATEAAKWYTRYLDCEPLTDRDDGVDCFGTEVVFESRATLGSSQRTGIDHISFSYADLTAKMGELASVGVGGSGVRLQRFEDGSTLRDVPGLFKYGFI
ncbi:MAG: VOC family protein, partial [bacterium]